MQAQITKLQKIEERNKTPEKEVNEMKRIEDELAKAMEANQAKEVSLKQVTKPTNRHD